ncbi:MAG: hypothetical protein EOL98_04410 [Negativicutes bacterium]|nr:hypothetical protein [Negativicutes bacterium]
MKILFRLLFMALFLCIGTTAFAAEEQGSNWEISMQPKMTAAEIENARWSFILQNDFGVYAYDNKSLKFDDKKDLVSVIVKTVFTSEDVLKKLNQTYADKLNNNDKTSYCEMLMLFNPQEKSYAVKKMDVYSKQGMKLETKENKIKMVPVPEKTFAEAMLEIAAAFVANENAKARN